MKIKHSTVEYIYYIVFGLFILLFVSGQFGSLTGVSLVVIDNPDPNSMYPTYFQGDLFLIYDSDPQDIEIGDVIVYKTARGHNIIHRVVDKVNNQGNWFFRVKGDDPVTNKQLDPVGESKLIPYDSLLGKVKQRIPYIGHISLTLQRNLAIRIFMYVVALGVAVGLLFLDEEEEEEEKYFNITASSVSKVMSSFISTIKEIPKKLLHSKNRFFYLTVTFTIVLLLISPMFLPVFAPTEKSYGVSKMEITYHSDFNGSNFEDASYDFYQVSVTLYDNSIGLEEIKGFKLIATTNSDGISDPISETKWKTLRKMKGTFTIGGSLLIEKSKLSDGQTFYITVIVEVSGLINEFTLDPHTITHTYSSSNS